MQSCRSFSWYLVDTLTSNSPLLILIAGNWNEILDNSKKMEGGIRDLNLMYQFKLTFNRNGFFYLGYMGNSYTWKRGLENLEVIWERLDRACASSSWKTLFSQY